MAVHAHHPSKSSFLFNREDEELIIDEMDNNMQQQQQSIVFFSNNLNNGFQQNLRKRGRDTSSSPSTHPASFQIMPPSSQHINHNHNQFVSTGLHLSFQDKNQCNLTAIVNQQTVELEQFLNTQGEKLRRTLSDRMRTHYRALLMAAEESASNQLREKELEINQTAKKAAELENRLARIRNESLTWQAKAAAEQEKAAAIQMQIQQAQLVSVRQMSDRADPEVEDSGSVYEDPKRAEMRRREAVPGRTCRVCGVSEVSVVMVPCRHLCMCDVCDAAFDNVEGTVCCPVCNVVRTGSIQVFLL